MLYYQICQINNNWGPTYIMIHYYNSNNQNSNDNNN